MLKPKKRWNLVQQNENRAKELSNELNLSTFVANLLINRGIETKTEAYSFMNSSKEALHDPLLMDDMQLLIDRVNKAISNEEKILVFGDYDADGVTSTSVMLKALKQMGAAVDYYIPNRFTEGYGPNEGAFRWAKDQGFTLIITVDTGISAQHEAQVAKELGMDLIITDHHEIPPELPEAFAIIHPRKPGTSYPFGELAGVGVALKVAEALLGEVPNEFLELATIGTIADLVPLRDENRVIASRGLRAIQNSRNLGIQALIKQCSLEDKEITEESIGFAIGPRINAAGRIDAADPAVELLMTDNREEAYEIAKEIDSLNQERQQLVNEITTEAVEEVEKIILEDEAKVIVVAKEGWNPGVIGIVASRLVEKYYRPTIVLSIDPEKQEAKGSARSIEGFDLFKNLSECRDLLPHFGGHTMAAGMTLKTENLNELRSRLNQLASEKLTDEDYIPVTEVDAICSVQELSIETIEEMQTLAPFGQGNRKPKILVEDASFSGLRRIGKNDNHLKITLSQAGQQIDGVGFGCGDLCDHISPISNVSVVGQLSINEWNGYRKPQIMIEDCAVTGWQLFDWRGIPNLEKHLSQIDQKKLQIVVFRSDTIEKLKLNNWNDQITCLESEDHVGMSDNTYLVLLDLPKDPEDLKQLLVDQKPERIYTVFHHSQDHYFSTLPTRDHFKWMYGFLSKQKTFNLNKHDQALAKKQGWTRDSIHFMVQVFFELGFVTIKDGIVELVQNPIKKDFSESQTYQNKQMELSLESELVYSSFRSLKQWFDQIYNSVELEEEIV